MIIPEEFLKSEVRDGYYIPAKMKRGWATMLTVLDEIDIVCKRHGLKWWIDWGSLIGTVRHKGFIPWDDDLDISMSRKDFDVFNRIANQELPTGYYAYSIESDPTYRGYSIRVANSKKISYEESFLNDNYGFPYMSGVDIFCIDYIPSDPEKKEELRKLIREIDMLAASIDVKKRRSEVPVFHKALRDISRSLKVSFNSEDPIAVQLYRLSDRLMASVKREEAEMSACMGMYALRDNFRAVFPKEYYEELVMLPYEFTEVPAPLHYDEMLKHIFGNYMKPYRGGGLHDFPFYCIQEDLIANEAGEDKLMWNTYAFQAEDIKHA